MPDPILSAPRPPPPALPLPLAGLVVLAVEDSRLAADGLRLLAQALGARLRRAGTRAEADRHLAAYRPDALLVDLGLPDGRGEGLIARLARDPRRPAVILGMSASADGRALALACGADGYIDKPILRGLDVAEAILAHLPERRGAGAAMPLALPEPDPLALADDLALAAELLEDPDPATRGWLSSFLAGIARQSGDAVLESAAMALADGACTGLLARLVEDRRAAALPF